MILGAHLSIAGGLERALIKAGEHGFDAVALFLRNQRQWAAPPLSEQTVEVFGRLRRELNIRAVVAHGSYLLNLAGEGEVRRRSMEAMIDDLDRCRRLGIEDLVIHPGSCPDQQAGLTRIARAVRDLLKASPGPVRVLLETTAGQGASLGWRFEHLAEMIHRCGRTARAGVCLDTAHVFAAGYDIRTAEAYEQTMSQFERIVGLERLHAVHVNDSTRELGSRVDRHAHVGRGRIGLAGFRCLVNDPRLARVPLILETPKGADDRGRDWDAVNARRLRRLRRRPGRSTSAARS